MEETNEDSIVHRVTGTNKKFVGYLIFCPACRTCHLFDSRWTFNGDMDKPTFRDSMDVKGNEAERERTNSRYGHRCHSYVTDGKIEFLLDCTHSMAGKTMQLERF